MLLFSNLTIPIYWLPQSMENLFYISIISSDKNALQKSKKRVKIHPTPDVTLSEVKKMKIFEIWTEILIEANQPKYLELCFILVW
jgi:hypothetical protein